MQANNIKIKVNKKALFAYIIINKYGNRGFWISDVAKDLKISKRDANHLTYMLGYRRGKKAELFDKGTFDRFSKDRQVQAILNTIQKNTINKQLIIMFKIVTENMIKRCYNKSHRKVDSNYGYKAKNS